MERIDERHLQPGRARRRYAVELASDPATRRAAQALRWRVFAGEFGVRLRSREPGIDHDEFDPYRDHLVVREEAAGEVVGTYRILGPQAARRIGGYCSDSGFDLKNLQWLRPELVEVGRSCIDPSHRNGAVIALLWSGLARYMLAGSYSYLAGCGTMSRSMAVTPQPRCSRNCARATWRPRRTACSRAAACRSTSSTYCAGRMYRRSCAAICARAPGSAVSRRGMPISTRPSSSCCCRSPA